MMRTIQALPLLEIQNTLGEGPLWLSEHGMLYWVDIEQKMVHGFEPHTSRHRTWMMPKRVSAVAGASNSKLVVGLQGEVAELDPFSGRVRTLLRLESDLSDNRCNDGQIDPEGRFWIGTMELDAKPNSGSLYCIDQALKIHHVLSGLTIANGMGWSPGGEFMYFIDSADYVVRRYRFSSERVRLSDEQVILQFEKEMPDGMCVDSEGMLWIGFWGGRRVGCYDPATGQHLVDVRVPAPHVTSCCFGGKDLRTLYITTARSGLAEEHLKAFPLSGSLFSCEPGVQGLPANIFASST